MTFLGASLADGQLSGAWNPIYTCPTGKKAIIRSMDFLNLSGVTQIIELRLTRDLGGTRMWPRALLLQNELARILTGGEVLVLSADDIIEGQSTSSLAVDYTITGAEE